MLIQILILKMFFYTKKFQRIPYYQNYLFKLIQVLPGSLKNSDPLIFSHAWKIFDFSQNCPISI